MLILNRRVARHIKGNRYKISDRPSERAALASRRLNSRELQALLHHFFDWHLRASERAYILLVEASGASLSARLLRDFEKPLLPEIDFVRCNFDLHCFQMKGRI